MGGRSLVGATYQAAKVTPEGAAVTADPVPLGVGGALRGGGENGNEGEGNSKGGHFGVSLSVPCGRP